MTTTNNRYDVIIVGGRPSGATLATRLAQGGANVLLLDRASFPSLPAVSSPIIYACTMALLDEIGVDESTYAYDTPQIRTVVTEARDHYRAVAKVPEDRGRNYAYALDRARFDNALWHHAISQSSVTGLDRFSVTDLLWEGERVIGIQGKHHDGKTESFYADIVVGADGRWSVVARKVNAPTYNVDEAPTTSLYYAYWKNVAPYDIEEPLMITHGTMDGLGYLMMDSADGTTAVVVEGYADVVESFSKGSGEAEAMYKALLQNAPRIWERVKDAERVTSVRGLKQTPNYYRQLGGPGWALVGDAAHHKDPLGGQGIYDAVFGAKALAIHYLEHKRGGFSWEKALAGYKEMLEEETLPVYYNTLAARANFRTPNYIQKLLGRWVCENQDAMDSMMRVPARMVKPEKVMTVPLLLESVQKGISADIQRAIQGGQSRAAVPPLPSEEARGIKPKPHLGLLGWMVAVPTIVMLNALFPIITRRR
jgi:flavin-dependent dehydrogenase